VICSASKVAAEVLSSLINYMDRDMSRAYMESALGLHILSIKFIHVRLCFIDIDHEHISSKVINI
jgi:hypothetical protein